MRAFWDAKARENAMFYIHSQLDYAHVDEAEFWASGRQNLDQTLSPFGLSIGPDDRVVEIGCGIGRMTRALAERAAHVVGVDVSAEMVERGRAALAGVPNAELLVGNGIDLSGVPSESADAVYSFIVFQHIPDTAVTRRYIEEIGRVLRPGGWTVFQISERPEFHRQESWRGTDGWAVRLRRLVGRAPRDLLAPEWLGSSLTRAELFSALDGAGLRLESTVGDGTQFCLVHARRPGGET